MCNYWLRSSARRLREKSIENDFIVISSDEEEEDIISISSDEDETFIIHDDDDDDSRYPSPLNNLNDYWGWDSEEENMPDITDEVNDILANLSTNANANGETMAFDRDVNVVEESEIQPSFHTDAMMPQPEEEETWLLNEIDVILRNQQSEMGLPPPPPLPLYSFGNDFNFNYALTFEETPAPPPFNDGHDFGFNIASSYEEVSPLLFFNAGNIWET